MKIKNCHPKIENGIDLRLFPQQSCQHVCWNGVLEVVGCLTSKLTSKRFPEMCRRLAVKDCHWVGLLLYFEFVFVCLCVGTFLLNKEFGVVLLPNC